MSVHKTLRLYREAYTGHPREIWILAWLTFINRTGTMVLPFLSVYATTVLGFSLKEAGLIMASFGFGSLGGSYFGGKFSDYFGGRLVIVGSLLMGGAMFISLQLAASLESLMALIFLAALFGEAYRPAMSTLVAQFVPKERFGRSMAFIRLAINLGFSAGPALGGVIAVSMGYKWLFWIDGVSCMVAAIFFAYASRNWVVQRIRKVKGAPPVQLSGQAPLRNPVYVIFLLSTLLMAFSFVQWFHTVPVFLKTAWAYDERVYGFLMGASSLIIVLVEMPLIHYIEENSLKRKALRLGLILLAGSFLSFLAPPALVMCFVAMLFFTFGETLYLPLNNSYSLLLSPDDRRGAYMSWYWMVWSMANILGPSVGFFTIDSFGYHVFWTSLVVLLSISLYLNYLIRSSS